MGQNNRGKTLGRRTQAKLEKMSNVSRVNRAKSHKHEKSSNKNRGAKKGKTCRLQNTTQDRRKTDCTETDIQFAKIKTRKLGVISSNAYRVGKISPTKSDL